MENKPQNIPPQDLDNIILLPISYANTKPGESINVLYHKDGKYDKCVIARPFVDVMFLTSNTGQMGNGKFHYNQLGYISDEKFDDKMESFNVIRQHMPDNVRKSMIQEYANQEKLQLPQLSKNDIYANNPVPQLKQNDIYANNPVPQLNKNTQSKQNMDIFQKIPNMDKQPIPTRQQMDAFKSFHDNNYQTIPQLNQPIPNGKQEVVNGNASRPYTATGGAKQNIPSL